MRGGAKPTIREVKTGNVLAEQGTQGDELYLLLNGVLVVEVDGEQLAELGPGAVLGERAVLEGGARTATLRAATDGEQIAFVGAIDVGRGSVGESGPLGSLRDPGRSARPQR